MSILFGAACIISIIFMIVFMFIGIWLFIVALKAFNQLRYKNYILEKINENLNILSKREDTSIDNLDDFILEDDNKNDDTNISSFQNLKDLK